MSGKPQLVLTRLSNREPFAYKCALCGQSFLLPGDGSPKERAKQLLTAFREHVREIHAAVDKGMENDGREVNL